MKLKYDGPAIDVVLPSGHTQRVAPGDTVTATNGDAKALLSLEGFTKVNPPKTKPAKAAGKTTPDPEA